MKRLTLAIAVALLMFASVSGMAASLDVTPNDLAGGAKVVSGCDDAVSVAFGLLGSDLSQITEVTVSGIDDVACTGQSISVQLLDTNGDVLSASTGTVDAASETLDVADVLISLVVDVTVTIAE